MEWIRSWMQDQPEAGYSRGVHDQDGAQILAALIELEQALGLLKFSPTVRARAWFTWQYLLPAAERESILAWIDSHVALQHLTISDKAAKGLSVGDALSTQAIGKHLAGQLAQCADGSVLRKPQITLCVNYLLAELLDQAVTKGGSAIHRLTVSAIAHNWWKEFTRRTSADSLERMRSALSAHRSNPVRLWQLAESVIDKQLSIVTSNTTSVKAPGTQVEPAEEPLSAYRDELVMLLIDKLKSADEQPSTEKVVAASSICNVTGLRGDHARIAQGTLRLDYHEFISRVGKFCKRTVPRFRALQSKKRELLHAAEQRLRTREFKTQVLTSFVRNRLIDEVFLPRIGENLAKQLGVAGENKRSDRMGLLLLVSPPGYGKTTLMEYIANRLGLVMVKVNGPALGHQVRSLDPAEATNAAARAEVNRINLALEMGDNVMLYLDDIQHCHPELLQKFISLCDATRRIEGVWEGQPKTYDLRGRKVAVVMAGNPYTESGERFQIPDMLANRADIYNLGEIIGGAQEAFEQSYLENCLTSNPSLLPLARAAREDQLALMRAAQRGGNEPLDLKGNFAADQLAEMLSIMRKLVVVRDIVLRVNRQYIQSAAQADAYRTEPPFKLQGSYRNMNRIAEKVASVMNDDELLQLVIASYEQDAQTLTRDGESNLLKFRELAGVMTEPEQQRWRKICYAYVESVRLGSMAGDDQALQVLKSLAAIRDGLETIRQEIGSAAEQANRETSGGLQVGIQQLADRAGQFGTELLDWLQRTGQLLEQNAARLPEQKVLVQHSVPRSMTELIRSQYQMLYDGLVHLLAESSTQTEAMQRLRGALNDMLEQYKNLQTEIDSAEPFNGAAES